MTPTPITLYGVGDTLKCLRGFSRRDRRASVNAGAVVRVTQEYKFQYDGKQCQDLTVQYGNDAPIAVLNWPGAFEKMP